MEQTLRDVINGQDKFDEILKYRFKDRKIHRTYTCVKRKTDRVLHSFLRKPIKIRRITLKYDGDHKRKDVTHFLHSHYDDLVVERIH